MHRPLPPAESALGIDGVGEAVVKHQAIKDAQGGCKSCSTIAGRQEEPWIR